MSKSMVIYGPNDSVVQTIRESETKDIGFWNTVWKWFDMLNSQYFTVEVFEDGRNILVYEWVRPFFKL